ncbi:galactose oxidase, central domain-containing protein [Hirsutella rhossiliensis]|uniref:Galactose oxidase, central domain-containing protein n=1 Tax=Hirsutella rhossiliensis TaxID=111463 RepID=A0A9P8N519_9HYPO|nr:galactose oxidase, central domain-containing protein [Hirsutella rhossiliensis]KAH0964782.1 galactose oxidase, central domain-containing protein [Hirsutella rhossiliensis]
MAHSAGLTGSQNPPRFSWSRPGANEPRPSIDAHSLDASPPFYRGVHQPRKNSAPGLIDPSSTSATGASRLSLRQPLPTAHTSPNPASQHARRLSLHHSLAKPLPQTPPASSTGATRDPDPRNPTIEPPAMDGRTSTMDSASSAASGRLHTGPDRYLAHMSTSSTSSLASSARRDSSAEETRDRLAPRTNGPASTTPSPATVQGRSPAPAAHVGGPSRGSSAHLSGLMCNVHRTTGREPPPLVGATTTILGDRLYVFGGRVISRSRPASLTSDLYELDLIRRHWSRLDTTGNVPPPRYFHSMCPLGDTKMVCYGGMSPAPDQQQQPQEQPEISVMSDIHIFDVTSKTWTHVPAQDAPQGRYAHCACVLPSAATFTSPRAPLSALQHNPPAGNPNEGRIGVNIDGSGGAEMVVVGGQDGGNHYIEQISVFNLRSLKWTSTQPLGKSCGAYRSVTAPLSPSLATRIGRAAQQHPASSQRPDGPEAREANSSMLIYSNYNFLDVKLELQIRASDGTLTERPMSGSYSPPGLRFPNGGIIDTHFVVSGTYLTSSKQEYALWALDLRTLTWSRIDAGGSVFSQGSWNRGVLWNRRNTFVILGNRKRSLVDDYNHRRINFSNVCMVELEAFGFYDNPRKTSPMSGFISASSPYSGHGLSITRKAGYTAAGRSHSRASEELGEKALGMRELADMDILCIGGERIPANSRIVARRWGPYFVQLLREGSATLDVPEAPTPRNASDSATTGSGTSGTSSLLSGSTSSAAASLTSAAPSAMSAGSPGQGEDINPAAVNTAPTPRSLPPGARPRCLYLPHTYLTVQALLHFLYASSLPPPSSPLCTPQILCSLLQIARPYRVDGLLEAVVERLHTLLDSRNAAAVFNATAMAAGGGRGIDGSLNPNFFVGSLDPILSPASTTDFSLGGVAGNLPPSEPEPTSASSGLPRLNTTNLAPQPHSRTPSGELSASTSFSGSEWDSERGSSSDTHRFVWNGELSSVIGLQKRGLRGLMEGRRMRERSGTSGTANAGGSPGYAGGAGGGQRVGLGIAGS